MLEPRFYPRGPASVELRETHISWVFLAGELAYKVKKPITLPFLDYGTLEKRHLMCREEVRLNRRLAPRIYRGVVGIAREGDRWALVSEDEPAAVEYAVEMLRVEEARSLAALAAEGRLSPEHIVATAGRIARFHSEAPPAPPRSCPVEDLEATLDENLTTLREAGASFLDERRLASADHFTRAFLAALHDQLESRARSGLIRDCHGDLRAEHVIVPDHGEVYVYDCVEFNAALREIDVAADLAFLVMDLAALGAEGLALELVDAYRAAGGDPGDDVLLSFFASYRAWVRAKVASLRALELAEGSPERAAVEAEARARLRLGHRFAWRARRPLVLVICGVAATGKTSLARELAELSGWRHVSSDVVRKRLAGLEPQRRGSPELYTPEFTERVYRELGAAARDELERSGAVIVDATFHRRAERDDFRFGLGAADAPLMFVECRASSEVLLARVRERGLAPGRISDADAGVVRRQLAAAEPLTEVPPQARAELLTTTTPEELAAEVESILDAGAWQRER